MRASVEECETLPSLNANELVQIVYFFSNLFVRSQVHQNQLSIFGGIQHASEILVLERVVFDVCYVSSHQLTSHFNEHSADLRLKSCRFATKRHKHFLLFAPFCGWLERDGLFGPELEFAVFVDFGFGLYASRDFDHVFENALAYFVNRLGAIDHTAGR